MQLFNKELLPLQFKRQVEARRHKLHQRAERRQLAYVEQAVVIFVDRVGLSTWTGEGFYPYCVVDRVEKPFDYVVILEKVYLDKLGALIINSA